VTASVCLSLAATATQTFSFLPRFFSIKKTRKPLEDGNNPTRIPIQSQASSDPRFDASPTRGARSAALVPESPPSIVLPSPRFGIHPQGELAAPPVLQLFLSGLVLPGLLVCSLNCCPRLLLLFLGVWRAGTVVCRLQPLSTKPKNMVQKAILQSDSRC
jgi:hypothetical protein